MFGVTWRLVGALFLLSRKDLSKPRETTRYGWSRSNNSRDPHRRTRLKRQFASSMSPATPGISRCLFRCCSSRRISLFFESVLGFSWPHLPNTIILVTAAVATSRADRAADPPCDAPVQRFISNADDYISIFVVLIPLVTGILAFAHVGGHATKRLLAIHLLSVEAMLIWFPFGKLMHAIMTMPARYQAGTAFGRRGVKA